MPSDAAPAEAPSVVSPSVAEAPIEPTVASKYPSLAFYPELHSSMLPALERKDAPAILGALAQTFRPVRPAYALWERTGHVRLDGPTKGFVREVDGTLEHQPPGRYDLSCAGGFLEAVRLLLLPTVELDELGRCDPNVLATVEGAPEECGHDGDFGWLALVNIAARLSPERLPNGRTVRSTPILRRDDVRADVAPGNARLCTVSHASRVHGGKRFHHHMMLMLEPDERGEIPLFDITGSRGVYLRPRPHNLIAKYAKHLLADNDAFGYQPRSTLLTCLDVTL
ncbi:MAG: hypothetical protein NXI35_28355 [bacterium]|nr:hypothetical protein [bacterium]